MLPSVSTPSQSSRRTLTARARSLASASSIRYRIAGRAYQKPLARPAIVLGDAKPTRLVDGRARPLHRVRQPFPRAGPGAGARARRYGRGGSEPRVVEGEGRARELL